MKTKFKYLTGTYVESQGRVTGCGYSGSYFTNRKDAIGHARNINSSRRCMFALDENENRTNEIVWAASTRMLA